MERLTWKDESGYYAPKNVTLNALKKRGELVDRLAAYEDTGLEPGDIEIMKAANDEMRRSEESRVRLFYGTAIGIQAERCAEIVKAETDCRLVVLPCKVGDTVWFNTYKNNATECVGIQPHEVKRVNVCFLTDGAEIPQWEFGKTVFLTREEAEKALKGVSEDA